MRNSKQPFWEKVSSHSFSLKSTLHLWLIRFDAFSDDLSAANRFLLEEEKERADRFHFTIDKKRYTVTRAYLRYVLGIILGVHPREIKFTLNTYGKPLLDDKSTGIHFNVSHSGNLGLIGISDCAPVGVDVEQFREKMSDGVIARRFFSSEEVKEFEELSGEQKLQGFFNCWSRKEAFIKAVGMGLSLPLEKFDVTLKPGQPALLKTVRYRDLQAGNFTLKELPVDDSYAAAFCIEAKPAQIHGFLATPWP